MKIGQLAPRFRVPALVKGEVVYLDSAHFLGNPIALCFLPALDLLEYALLERHVPNFDEQKVLFLGVVSDESFFSGPWRKRLWPRGLTLLSNPLGRLYAHYGVPHLPDPLRCRSFAIDPQGLVRYHLVHDLNGRGMSALLEILKASQTSGTQRSAISVRATDRSPLLTSG
mgnify:CR=1 FL=1